MTLRRITPIPGPIESDVVTGSREIRITQGDSYIEIAMETRPDKSVWGQVHVHIAPDDPFTSEQQAFLDTLRETCFDNGTLTLELDGQKWTGARITSMSRST